MHYYDENGYEITREKFNSSEKTLSLFFENDTMSFGVSLKRENYGRLDANTLDQFHNYLSKISGRKIDSTKNIVINYITGYPKRKDNTKEKSTWNVLKFPKEYRNRLNRKANADQFWVHSPDNDNLEYYHSEKIEWYNDKERIFESLFFPYEVAYGNFILLKPNGEYFFFLGEYGEYEIWHFVNSFLK